MRTFNIEHSVYQTSLCLFLVSLCELTAIDALRMKDPCFVQDFFICCGVMPFSLECDYLLENASCCGRGPAVSTSAPPLQARSDSLASRENRRRAKHLLLTSLGIFSLFPHLNLDALLNALHFLAPSSCRLEGIVSSDRAPRRVARNSVNYRLCLQVDNEKRFTRYRNG
jgi:hypothetical protein